MSNLNYSLLNPGDGEFISVVAQGRDIQSARFDHPNFARIVELARADDLGVFDLFDIAKAAGARFERLSERVTAKNGRLYLDGDEINNALTAQVVRFLDAGVEDWKPLVAFFEKVQSNTNDHSREQLFRFLDANGMVVSLASDGDIVAYKGMQRREDEQGVFYVPSSHGTGNHVIVNGVDYPDSTDDEAAQRPGDVVELPRSEVRHDPNTHCSVGLHIATYNYANSYGNVVVEVRVNPRDVVSVPNDANEKVRACRYTIVGEVDGPHQSPVVFTHAAPEQTEEEAHEEALDAPEGTYGEPVVEVEVTEVDIEFTPAAEASFLEFTPEQGLSVASDLDSDAPVAERGRYPKPADFEEMQRRAKRRRRNFAKYATKHGPWTLVGEDPANRKHWSVNA